MTFAKRATFDPATTCPNPGCALPPGHRGRHLDAERVEHPDDDTDTPPPRAA